MRPVIVLLMTGWLVFWKMSTSELSNQICTTDRTQILQPDLYKKLDQNVPSLWCGLCQCFITAVVKIWNCYAPTCGGGGGIKFLQQHFSHYGMLHIVRWRSSWLGSIFITTDIIKWDLKDIINLENLTWTSSGPSSNHSFLFFWSIPHVLFQISSFIVRQHSVSSEMWVNSMSKILESFITLYTCWWTVFSLILATCITAACFCHFSGTPAGICSTH